MHLKYRFLAIILSAIALGALVGCAPNIERVDGYTRPASSVTVRFYVPSGLTIYIRRDNGMFTRPIVDEDREVARREVGAMMNGIESQLNTRISEVLTQSGLKAGDDLVLAVSMEAASHVAGPGGNVNVRAMYKNPPPGTRPWSVTVKLGSASLGATTPELAATAFVDRIMQEIQTANLIGQAKK